eukprot:Sspe_Gene.25505::Locus_10268_Transcript_1_1_Confidence_1.000_Length_804::g.25505::m.25505
MLERAGVPKGGRHVIHTEVVEEAWSPRIHIGGSFSRPERAKPFAIRVKTLLTSLSQAISQRPLVKGLLVLLWALSWLVWLVPVVYMGFSHGKQDSEPSKVATSMPCSTTDTGTNEAQDGGSSDHSAWLLFDDRVLSSGMEVELPAPSHLNACVVKKRGKVHRVVEPAGPSDTVSGATVYFADDGCALGHLVKDATNVLSLAMDGRQVQHVVFSHPCATPERPAHVTRLTASSALFHAVLVHWFR